MMAPAPASLFDSLAANPYFSAGFGLFGLGTAATLLRTSAVHGLAMARRRLLVTLEIPSRDKSYAWVLHWLTQLERANATAALGSSSAQTTTAKPSSAASVASALFRRWRPPSHQLSVETTFQQHDHGAATTQFRLVPGVGSHWMPYRGAWLQITRHRDSKMLDLHNAAPWETVQITTLRAHAEVFGDFLREAKDHAMQAQAGKTVIYTSYGPEWRPFGQPRKKRPIGSVVLEDGVAEGVVRDVKRFLENWAWYNERGIPYRRGYLLHGPPGSGKSSFIQALAGELEYNICILNLSERGLTDDRLNHLMTVLPARSILLLEDADAAFNRRAQTSEQGYVSGVTFSGLLNALDGVAAAEERLIFMTTNHFDRLDPALVRPGRVDVKIHVGWPTDAQLRVLFTRFYGQDTVAAAALADAFVHRVKDARGPAEAADNSGSARGPSMAALQGHFIVHRDSAQAAVDHVGDLFAPPVAVEPSSTQL
ncbi:BCS1 N terminal-domain-containing protein [Blastocladiella britannica]|nr:BCS1 N terminal-domain-containing protein [Blastocladiella britannica]